MSALPQKRTFGGVSDITMLIPITAAILTLVGAFSLVVSSLVGTGTVSDFFFSTATFCLIVGPIIFLSYVVIGLCIEFVAVNRKPEMVAQRRTPSFDSADAPPVSTKRDEWIPEGLRRQRRGPLGPIYGRASNI